MTTFPSPFTSSPILDPPPSLCPSPLSPFTLPSFLHPLSSPFHSSPLFVSSSSLPLHPLPPPFPFTPSLPPSPSPPSLTPFPSPPFSFTSSLSLFPSLPLPLHPSAARPAVLPLQHTRVPTVRGRSSPGGARHGGGGLCIKQLDTPSKSVIMSPSPFCLINTCTPPPFLLSLPLPSTEEFHGLWDSLVFDTGIKQNVSLQ